jgi:hypothetical protein
MREDPDDCLACRNKLDKQGENRDAAGGMLVYRSIPFLVLSLLILASTSIVVAAKKA